MRILHIAYVFHILGKMIAEAGHLEVAVYQIYLGYLIQEFIIKFYFKKSWMNIKMNITLLQ